MSRLWAITSYFNPAGYRRKLSNYREFRKRLAVPLAAVELSHSGDFELGRGDAEILAQLRGGDVMWQKERLLNIALARLPKECDYVAWLDCDVIFSRPDWPPAAMRELEGAGVCQLYRSVYHLAPDAASISRECAILRYDSLGYAFANGLNGPGGAGGNGGERVFKRGHAWAARRETLAGHGFYDRNVLGGGDSLLAHAAKGRVEEVIARHGMTAAHAGDYRRWAARFRAAVKGIGYIDGDLYHLWHGNLEQRLYRERLRILSACEYDPAADITLDAEGCWRWNSPKPQLHRMVKEYFERRNEDGAYALCAAGA